MGRRAKCLNLHIPVKNYLHGVSAPRVLRSQPVSEHNYNKLADTESDEEVTHMTSLYEVMLNPRPSAQCIWNAFLRKHHQQCTTASNIEVSEVGRPEEWPELKVRFANIYILPQEWTYFQNPKFYDAIALYEAIE
jgi:hypothetical protein